ncbi:MAG: Thioredoxin [uncultured Sulfurovum sp.]|uniref:Thioredoxin n=1 Tax=uncultured Sulfurovum sp. TaxID=269237 RepID=A0A6S6U1K3_9BACT|nr:MAG: Thioredoxin [uncultured Sulfurovum sp.]
MKENTPLEVQRYADVQEHIGNGNPTIIAFGMSHCYSCLAMSKLFAEVLKEHPEYQIYSVDGQKERLILRDKYKLKLMPVQLFFDAKGNEVFRHEGAYKKAVLEIILKKYGFGNYA